MLKQVGWSSCYFDSIWGRGQYDYLLNRVKIYRAHLPSAHGGYKVLANSSSEETITYSQYRLNQRKSVAMAMKMTVFFISKL